MDTEYPEKDQGAQILKIYEVPDSSRRYHNMKRLGIIIIAGGMGFYMQVVLGS